MMNGISGNQEASLLSAFSNVSYQPYASTVVEMNEYAGVFTRIVSGRAGGLSYPRLEGDIHISLPLPMLSTTRVSLV
jgi:hypothetical protein